MRVFLVIIWLISIIIWSISSLYGLKTHNWEKGFFVEPAPKKAIEITKYWSLYQLIIALFILVGIIFF